MNTYSVFQLLDSSAYADEVIYEDGTADHNADEHAAMVGAGGKDGTADDSRPDRFGSVDGLACQKQKQKRQQPGLGSEFWALFGLPHIQLLRLLFSAGTVFFSHNNSAVTVFFS